MSYDALLDQHLMNKKTNAQVLCDGNGSFFYVKSDKNQPVAVDLEPEPEPEDQHHLANDKYFPISATSKRTGIGSYRSAKTQKNPLTSDLPPAKPWCSTYGGSYNNPADRKPKPVTPAMEEGKYNPKLSVAFGLGYGSRHPHQRMYLTTHDNVPQ
mmetsp:Transcript_5467/g.8560  ORF Transcript_5467/g.8560 Transcript_5467/m.8560 type:complete len:155 (-) Transcript_5467:279-743(-)|eukprot:CAMPEP_0175088584 /NCGR_PEP_ID=MMETSP0086_2-20121207/324_1 /TAXON_ID=136419 /ORGANISM="Unknown Unknown, Strain D1" /LENGTH=154 /DNA_ID=CAMNT_0016361023 /DNA_START=36 /DNA_END=500 /DNA_ORIENTATION=+